MALRERVAKVGVIFLVIFPGLGNLYYTGSKIRIMRIFVLGRSQNLQEGGQCRVNEQCFSGYCVNSICAADSPVRGKVGNGGLCHKNEQCYSNSCGPHGLCQANGEHTAGSEAIEQVAKGTCRIRRTSNVAKNVSFQLVSGARADRTINVIPTYASEAYAAVVTPSRSPTCLNASSFSVSSCRQAHPANLTTNVI